MNVKLFFVPLIIILSLAIGMTASANNGIEVVGSASPDTLNDGETTYIIISIENNTNKMIYVTHISIDNVIYDVDFIVDKGITQVTDNLYTVNFGLNNSIGIPISISYDTNNDGNYLNDTTVYGSHVYMYRQDVPSTAPPTPNVDFVVSADNVDINEGDFVNYTITTTNTSGTDCDNFTVVTNGSDIETFPMMTGTTRTIYFSEQYFGDAIQEFGYYFYYGGGWYYEQIPDSTFNITIIPDTSATQQSLIDTPSPTPSPTNTSNAANTPTPAPAQTTAQAATATTESTNNANDNLQITSTPSNITSNTISASTSTTTSNSITPAMLTLIIVCSLLLLAVIILAIVIIKHK